ncbi:DUF2897 family protein [Catenovulum sp. 2E275]|uniref:DUF2897 family protein n=1 Tax=Catenovulum sp. 2E275 TaxID=2980497 RepID=UPI0021D1249D|nr:DUF2897 family protein [Catenovulum sp. 2E275]MCU4674544.1 DUF2897 family protein [Catenovulum sp. 2E275]
MSSLTIVLIIIVVLAFIIGPIFMLDGKGNFNIPKGFKNKQGYDQEEDDWPTESKSNEQTSQTDNDNKPPKL